jgi:nitrate/nitrite transporter NarK
MAPPEKTAKYQGYQGGAFCLGTVVPYLCLSFGGGVPWKWAYLICAMMFAVLLLTTVLVVRKSIDTYSSGNAVRASVLFKGLPAILKSKEIWALGLFHGFSYGSLNNLGQWLPSIMSEKSGRPLSFWSMATVIILMIGTASRATSGLLLAKTSRRLATLGVIGAIAIFYFGMGLGGGVWPTLLFGLALASVSGLNYGPIFNLGSLIMAPIYMGTALGFMNMVANLGNVFLTLTLGYAKEYTNSFQFGLAAAGVASILALVFFSSTVWRLDLRLSQGPSSGK